MTMIGLHNLHASLGSNKNKIRRGRGNASGRGNYSGRGGKGQRARSGGKAGLNLMGIKSYLQRIPKNKGFNSLAIRKETVNLGELDSVFKTGELVDIKALVYKGLIRSDKTGLKVLAGGKLTKPLTVKANAFSESAKEAIIKAGGKVEEIKKEKVKNQQYAASRVKKTK